MRLLLLLLAALCFAMAYPSMAQPAPCPFLDTVVSPRLGTLVGRVVDSAGRPIAGATVAVLGSRPMRGAVTGREGDYCVAGLIPGVYRLRVTAVGFYRDTGCVVSIVHDRIVVLDIMLDSAHGESIACIIRMPLIPPIEIGRVTKIQSIGGEELQRRARSGLFGTPP